MSVGPVLRVRGMTFITFEGIDGSGKTLQAKLLKRKLEREGINVWLTEEPTRGEIGNILRDFIGRRLKLREETVALLFAADRLEHIKEVEEKISSGFLVISDRYLLSSLAYQGSLLPLDWVEEINRYALEKLPDLVILLDIEPEIARRRKANKGFFDTDLGRLSRVRNLYLAVSERSPWREITVKIDASKSPEEVHLEVLKALREKGIL